MTRSAVRLTLKVLMVAGIALMPIGPCARMSNEGFGDPPGPIQVSLWWQRVSYVLIPLGALLTIGAGVGLVIIDRRSDEK